MNEAQRELKHLLTNNKTWADKMRANDPEYFTGLTAQQSPKYLWIGCSDSRVPANTIIGLAPGEVFVHRNVGNVVVHTDFNCLSVIQYAVQVLQVEHIIVCGHYGCGGVRAALETREFGLIDNWLRHVKDVYMENEPELAAIADTGKRLDRLCELNVEAQVAHVCQTTIVQGAWRAGQELAVHGWIYSIEDGLIRDLGLCISAAEQLDKVFRMKKQK
jgi:carbonic anhydrase